MPKKVVSELTQVEVDGPLRDGAPAFVRRLGVFSKRERAAAWLAREVAEEAASSHMEDAALSYYVTDELVLDGRLSITHSVVHERDGRPRGVVPGDRERPWGGRPTADCRFMPRDLVGFVAGTRYRIGIVLTQPLSPEQASVLSGATAGDDVYLVGELDERGNPECSDHQHLPEPLLFAVEHEIPAELRAALTRRFETSGWAAPPGG